MKNKQLWVLTAAALLCAVNNGLTAATGSYYFEYIVGDLEKMSIVGTLGIFTPFVLLLFPLAVRKVGGMNFVRIGLVTAIIGNVIKYFAGANMGMILAGSIISMIPGASALMMIGSIFVIQCMDHGEKRLVSGWKEWLILFMDLLQSRRRSSEWSVRVIMAMAGFISGAAEQSGSALMAVRMWYSLVPAVICGLMLIILHFYTLERDNMRDAAEKE